MGDRSPSKPIQTHFGWDTAGLFLDFGWAFPADGVVPSSAFECLESTAPAEGTACDPRQARPFYIQKPGIETMRPYHWVSYVGSLHASSSVCFCQFFSTWYKYHPRLHSSDYIPSNRRRCWETSRRSLDVESSPRPRSAKIRAPPARGFSVRYAKFAVGSCDG